MASTNSRASWLLASARPRDIATVFSSKLFDLEHYRYTTGIALPSRLHAIVHFVTVGGAYDPHPLFSVRHYLQQAGSLIRSANPLIDYIRGGAKQRLQPHPLFDAAWYAARYAKAHTLPEDDMLEHFLREGWREGLKPHALFDTQWYLQTYPDVAYSGMNPLIHFVQHGTRERRRPSQYFDTDWYLQSNSDVAAAGHIALVHFLTHGAAEGRDPSPNFQTQWYWETNADVRASACNPLIHFAEHGAAEGRRTTRPEPPSQLDEDFGLSTETFAKWRRARIANVIDRSAFGSAQKGHETLHFHVGVAS